MGRAPCCDKANVKKGPWSPEEDAKLKSYIEQNGTGGNWIALPQKIGLKRCGKSCRLRWLNYLRPNIKHGGFSDEEDNIICSLYISIGSRWSIIAAQLPGRTDNDIKNYWNTKLKKKLLGKQQQHQARRIISGLKQEISPVMNMTNYEASYWPESSVLAPIIPYSNQDARSLHEQATIRRLLIKLGERFSSNDESIDQQQNGSMDQQLFPFNVMSNSPPNVIYPLEGMSTGYNSVSTSVDALNSPTTTYQFEQFSMGGGSGMDLLQGLEHQPNGVGQLGMAEGLEFLYGDELYSIRNGEENMMITYGDIYDNHTQIVEDSIPNINNYDRKGMTGQSSSSFDERKVP
ncbi:unnamed protein product [Rhodiola kirilowii]